MTMRTTYKPGHTGDEVVKEVDAVLADVIAHGVTKKELANAKTQLRSNLYDQLESSSGRAHILATLALFRDDPASVNKLLAPFETVTQEQVQEAAKRWMVPENRTVIDRVPATAEVTK